MWRNEFHHDQNMERRRRKSKEGKEMEDQVEWQKGDVIDCKSKEMGSIPVST